MNEKINNFSKKAKEIDFSINEIGIKGVFLQNMFKAKVLVPAGFIITTAFIDYMEETGILEKIESLTTNNLSINDLESVVRVSNSIVSLIRNTEIPLSIREGIEKEHEKLDTKFSAIRVSLLGPVSRDPSIKDEYTSILNVDREKLIESLKSVWASFYYPVAVIYRLKNNLKLKDQLGVVLIQKMVDAEISGVCFTSHPISNDHDQIVIEANLGLSKTINTHGIARDTYVVAKNNGEIIGRTIRRQEKMLARIDSSTKEVEVASIIQSNQKLRDEQIAALSKLSVHIEKYYENIPQKIEWAFENNKFYVLESQPISE